MAIYIVKIRVWNDLKMMWNSFQTLALLFQKRIYSLIKSYSFHFNISQVNLTSDWALNQHWVLEFSIIGERGPEL